MHTPQRVERPLREFSPALSPIHQTPNTAARFHDHNILPGIAEDGDDTLYGSLADMSFMQERPALQSSFSLKPRSFPVQEDSNAARRALLEETPPRREKEDEGQKSRLDDSLASITMIDEAPTSNKYNLNSQNNLLHDNSHDEDMKSISIFGRTTPITNDPAITAFMMPEETSAASVHRDVSKAEDISRSPSNSHSPAVLVAINNSSHSKAEVVTATPVQTSEAVSETLASIASLRQSTDSLLQRTQNRSLIADIQRKYHSRYQSELDQSGEYPLLSLYETRRFSRRMQRSSHVASLGLLHPPSRDSADTDPHAQYPRPSKVSSGHGDKSEAGIQTEADAPPHTANTSGAEVRWFPVTPSSVHNAPSSNAATLTNASALAASTANSNNLPVGSVYALLLDNAQHPVLVPFQQPQPLQQPLQQPHHYQISPPSTTPAFSNTPQSLPLHHSLSARYDKYHLPSHPHPHPQPHPQPHQHQHHSQSDQRHVHFDPSQQLNSSELSSYRLKDTSALDNTSFDLHSLSMLNDTSSSFAPPLPQTHTQIDHGSDTDHLLKNLFAAYYFPDTASSSSSSQRRRQQRRQEVQTQRLLVRHNARVEREDRNIGHYSAAMRPQDLSALSEESEEGRGGVEGEHSAPPRTPPRYTHTPHQHHQQTSRSASNYDAHLLRSPQHTGGSSQYFQDKLQRRSLTSVLQSPLLRRI